MAKGYFLVGIGLAMILFDVGIEPVFSIQITAGFKFPVGVLAALVGALYVISARVAQQQAQLTQAEIVLWGKQLELATPRIIALSEQQLSTAYIAETVEKEANIPQDILIKYMYALRNYLKAAASARKAEERRHESAE